MATLTVYARDAVETYVAASALGDVFRNDGNTELVIVNEGGAGITVTIPATRACRHGFLDDEVFTVSAGVERRAGPFDHARFGDAQGRVQINYSDVTGVSVAAKRLA